MLSSRSRIFLYYSRHLSRRILLNGERPHIRYLARTLADQARSRIDESSVSRRAKLSDEKPSEDGWIPPPISAPMIQTLILITIPVFLYKSVEKHDMDRLKLLCHIQRAVLAFDEEELRNYTVAVDVCVDLFGFLNGDDREKQEDFRSLLLHQSFFLQDAVFELALTLRKILGGTSDERGRGLQLRLSKEVQEATNTFRKQVREIYEELVKLQHLIRQLELRKEQEKRASSAESRSEETDDYGSVD